ncbi:MAG: TolC family protein [Chthoniobacterales bacterium]
MRLRSFVIWSSLALTIFPVQGAPPRYTIEQAIEVARAQNPDIAIAQKKVQAARGGLVEARAGYLPSVVSSGIYRQRERQGDSRLRPEDYNANIRVVEPLYTGGATTGKIAIARLNFQKAEAQLEAVTARVTMEVRLAFYELLLNRARIQVREESVEVLKQELKSQRERLSAGTVGQLNVGRAEVSLANEEPELIQAKTDLRNSYLRLGELLGAGRGTSGEEPFAVAGELIYEPRHPDLNHCLEQAGAQRPEVRSAEADVAIEEQQLRVDRSATRPQIEAFSGYEIYNERDPSFGREFNHGYIVGLNASWALFDGFATRGRMQATRARREAAGRALQALRLSISSEVRSAFLDLEQADQVMESAMKNVQTADESLQIANGNLAAGLGTQLDVLQAANDRTRTRSTRLSATYLHNAALARLDRACGGSVSSLGGEAKSSGRESQILSLTRPPATLGDRP